MERSAAGIQLPPSPLSTLDVARPADLRVLFLAGLSAAWLDLALHSGVAGLAGALLVAIVSAGLLASGRLANPQSKALVAAAPLFGVWLFVRMSPWLLPFDIVAAGGLLLIGASLAGGGSVLDLSVPAALTRFVWAVSHAIGGLAFGLAPLARVRVRVGLAGSPRTDGRVRAAIRGVLLGAPLLVLLGVLLASADAVFASFFRIQVDVDPVAAASHVAALGAGAWGMMGLLRVASARPLGAAVTGRGRLGGVEATVVLALLDGLFAAFAAAQLVVLSGGGRHVIETAGLTYAEYARSGFFQLLAAAALTLASLMALWGFTDRGDRRVGLRLLVLAEVAVALTLVIVFVAVRRMDLYEEAFGLTMLRLYVKVACFWIAGVFVLLGLFLAGLWGPRAWLVPAAGALGLVALLALNVANPEGVVVRHNIAHAERGRPFDASYLGELSQDAIPTILAELPRLETADRVAALEMVCAQRGASPFMGWAATNISRDRADRQLMEACPASTGDEAPRPEPAVSRDEP